MMVNLRRLAVTVVAAVATLTAAAAVAPAAHAAAAHAAAPVCDWYPGANGEGYAFTKYTMNIKTGPYSACTTSLVVTGGRKIWIWCTYQNEHGNWWTYGRLDKSEFYGWFYNGDINSYYSDEDGDGRIEMMRC